MIYKLIIIGSGPAGYTAGLYSARAELKPLVFAGERSGGQLMNTALVENWPGAEKGVLGPDLMMEMRKQAEKFGAEMVDKKVTKVDFSQHPFKVWDGKDEYQAQTVIVATGAESMRLGIPGERELMGRGVAVCAVCDAPFYRDKTVLVVGGGNAAAEDALALTKYARKVFLVHRRDKLRATKIMVRRVEENDKIEILWNTELKEIRGKDKVEEVVLATQGQEDTVARKADGVFLAIGHKPATEMFKGQIELDRKGYIKTAITYPSIFNFQEPTCLRRQVFKDGFPTMTTVAGVFAPGDVVAFRHQQPVTAAGMGCMAALDAEKYLEDRV
jgi:thioredoxin reductase (NADPH)